LQIPQVADEQRLWHDAQPYAEVVAMVHDVPQPIAAARGLDGNHFMYRVVDE
jgi:hypothetical protein